MKRLHFISLLVFFTTGVAAQTSSSAEIYLGLKKLNVLGSVLYVAAHPDDENTRLLTWLSKEGLYRTGYLSLTRGDGGQNLIGNEQGIELGLIRTQELLAARRIDGAEQYFTRAYDFGYSKTPVETFEKWNKEKVLADVVWVIRQTQPDVIITRFPTTGEGGHGHHTASAILANEAFTAAADKNKFPEQLKWVQPWQAKRIVWNTFNFGSNNTQKDDQLKIDVGAYNAVLGRSYGEIAADSRSQHKSQGFGVPRSRGEALEYFTTTGGAQPKTDLFENITTDWSRIAGSENTQKLIQKIINEYDFVAPQQSVPQLVALYKNISALPKSYWQQQKKQEVESLIEQASGLFLEAYTTEPFVAQTDSVRMNFSINNRLGSSVILKVVSVAKKDTLFNTTLLPNRNLIFIQALYVSDSIPVTQPYWLEEKMNEGSFTINDQTNIGKPDVQPAFIARFLVSIGGEDFVFSKPVKFKYTDPVRGELYQPFIVIPPLLVTASPSLFIQKAGSPNKDKIIITAKANKTITATNTSVNLQVEGGKTATQTASLNSRKGATAQYEFRVPIFNNKKEAAQAIPFLKIDTAKKAYNLAQSSISYEHIPNINYFYTDAVKLLAPDIKTAGKKIGYITGAGDKVPEALTGMGYEVTLLGNEELEITDLQNFDAIITGVRAYNTNDWMGNHYSKLMTYVENGGNLIVQYNTSNNIGTVKSKIGPYNFTISRNRITNEGAAVTFIDPAHPVLNFPNRITVIDFNGWIQERSIYDAINFDKAFTPVFSMADPGEKADSGSLIIAKLGKGYFTYTGLVFFRELPAGVPGAYRLLANIIALNKKEEL